MRERERKPTRNSKHKHLNLKSRATLETSGEIWKPRARVGQQRQIIRQKKGQKGTVKGRPFFDFDVKTIDSQKEMNKNEQKWAHHLKPQFTGISRNGRYYFRIYGIFKIRPRSSRDFQDLGRLFRIWA